MGFTTDTPNGINDHAPKSDGSNGNESARKIPADGTLDLMALGMNSGTAMDGIDCALVHYTQASPDAPLHMNLLHVSQVYLSTTVLTVKVR